MAQKKEFNRDNMIKEEVRKEIWQNMWDLDIKRRTYLKAKKLNALTVLPLIICSFLYSCYLSYFVPFLGIKNITKLSLARNIKFLKPIAKFFKDMLEGVAVTEPGRSVLGLIIFGFIVPLILGIVIKVVIKNKTKKKYQAEFVELTGNAKEQYRNIIDKYNNTETGSYARSPGFVPLIVFSVIINFLFIGSGRLIDALPKIHTPTPVLIVLAAYIVIAIFYGMLLKVREVKIYDEMRSYWDAKYIAEEKLQEIKEQEEQDRKDEEERIRNAKLLEQMNLGFDCLERGDYKKAQTHLCAKGVIELKGHSDDVLLGKEIAEFKMEANPSKEGIASILGTIKKHTVYYDKGGRSESLTNETLKRLCKEITEAYEPQIIDEVMADYGKGMQLFSEAYDDDGYIKAMAYLKLPSLMLYCDAHAAYALARLLGENRADDYEEIYEQLMQAKKYGIESKEVAQLTKSYMAKIQDCWRQDRENAAASYRKQQSQESDQERYKRLAICRYYNAGICNYKSGSVIHHCYHGDGTWLMCGYYKNSVY